MLFAVIFVIGILCGIGAWFFNKYSELTWSLTLSFFCVIALLVGSFGGIAALIDYSSYDARCYELGATRAVLIDELYKYDEMREVDVNASPIYLELKEKVIDFNKKIIYAEEHNNIWLNYFCSDPAYTTVDIIELEVK